MNNKTKKLSSLIAIAALCAVLTACGSKPESTQGGGGTPTPSSAAPTSKPTVAPTATPGHKTWKSAPAMTIDSKKSYEASFETNKGSFKVALYADTAPQTVNNFVFLAKEDYYKDV